jgi:DNA-binding response OmpR family regulator
VRDYSPDVVIIDVHLRVGGGVDVNGFELLRQIRRDEFLKDSKVIMYSGMDLRLESKQSGADDFIMKPFMPDELIRKINNLVE